MANVKIIEELYDTACRNGMGYRTRSGTVLYSVRKNDSSVIMVHYGTTTLEIKYGEIHQLYGISRSDVDSINTLLLKLGINTFHVGFKPVNGGFYAYINSLRKELFVDNYETRRDFARDVQSHLSQGEALSKFLLKKEQNPMPVL